MSLTNPALITRSAIDTRIRYGLTNQNKTECYSSPAPPSSNDFRYNNINNNNNLPLLHAQLRQSGYGYNIIYIYSCTRYIYISIYMYIYLYTRYLYICRPLVRRGEPPLQTRGIIVSRSQCVQGKTPTAYMVYIPARCWPLEVVTQRQKITLTQRCHPIAI